MNAVKIIRIVALVLAIAAALVEIQYALLVLLLLGLANGFMGVSEERRLIFLVTAAALAIAYDSLNTIPGPVGEYLTAIFGNISLILNAGVIAVVVMIIKDRLTE